jgi:hypothetical protein
MARRPKSPAWHRTAKARAKQAYSDMKQRCGNANGKCPSYTSVELRMSQREWLAWAIPRYECFLVEHPDTSPCAARRRDTGHYEIGNIEIISIEENREQQSAPCRLRDDGTKLCGRCRVVKTAESFNKNRRRGDGLNHWCRDCCREHRGSKKLGATAFTTVTCDACGKAFELRNSELRLRLKRNKSGKIACSRSCGNRVRSL